MKRFWDHVSRLATRLALWAATHPAAIEAVIRTSKTEFRARQQAPKP